MTQLNKAKKGEKGHDAVDGALLNNLLQSFLALLSVCICVDMIVCKHGAHNFLLVDSQQINAF